MTEPFVPHRLTSERQRQRVTVTRLARDLGVTRQTIHNWESGAASPSPDDVRLLAKALGIDPAWFYTPRRIHVDLHDAFICHGTP